MLFPVEREREYQSEPDETVSRAARKQLAAYYEHKTEEILKRYGPGPRVHYHTGLPDLAFPREASRQGLSCQLVAAQEQMLRYAAEAWRLRSIPFHDVLDVGCGLGGGAIFWAQEFGAHVTALTIAPSHIGLVERFAAQAGVAARVTALLCDALAVPGESCFDAAIAIDSSSSFPRRPWFRRLAMLLRPGGHVFIYDCFLVRSEYEKPFNRHWCTRIGTIEEYLDAGRAAHFSVKMIDDVSPRAVHFWTTTLAFMKAEAREKGSMPSESAKLRESLEIHALVRQGLLEGGLRHALMSFVKD
jgi:cyclopropane fatty-acyl-phospholipid synthase-like methyltransferase